MKEHPWREYVLCFFSGIEQANPRSPTKIMMIMPLQLSLPMSCSCFNPIVTSPKKTEVYFEFQSSSHDPFLKMHDQVVRTWLLLHANWRRCWKTHHPTKRGSAWRSAFCKLKDLYICVVLAGKEQCFAQKGKEQNEWSRLFITQQSSLSSLYPIIQIIIHQLSFINWFPLLLSMCHRALVSNTSIGIMKDEMRVAGTEDHLPSWSESRNSHPSSLSSWEQPATR